MTYPKKPFIYVAGPMTLGSAIENVRNAIDIGDLIMRHSGAPFVPHLSFFQQMVHQHEYEAWLAIDEEIVLRCDALYRMPGESPGADREVRFAKENGIPVLQNLDALVTWIKDWRLANG